MERNFLTLFFLTFFSYLSACDHCKSINEFVEMQYNDYRMILEYKDIPDRSYIEGKADAYREMTYFLEHFIYSDLPRRS